jgi:hypothetical protein
MHPRQVSRAGRAGGSILQRARGAPPVKQGTASTWSDVEEVGDAPSLSVSRGASEGKHLVRARGLHQRTPGNYFTRVRLASRACAGGLHLGGVYVGL